MESMLTHGEKYHNVRKNLTKLSDKIDSAETLYAILNPLVTKQLQVLVGRDVGACIADGAGHPQQAIANRVGGSAVQPHAAGHVQYPTGLHLHNGGQCGGSCYTYAVL